MGILATPIAPHPIMEEQPTRRLHPFFTSEREHALATPQPHSHNGSGVTEPRNEPTSVTHPEHISIDGAHSSDRPQKRRRTDGGDDGACEAERRVRMEATASSDSASLPQITPNNQAETIPVSLTTPNAVTDLQPAANPSLIQSAAGTATTGPNETPTEKSTPGSDTKAKKLIKFNPKTGTLGSPPQPKASEKTSAKTSTKRGRPRKKFIASMKYGGDDAATRARIGEQISRILAPKPDNVEPAGPSNVPTQPAATPKPAHPFFSKKSKKSPPSGSTPSTPQAIDRPKPPRQVVFSSTPCSPKRSRPAASKQGPQFGIKSLGLKVPGATLPLWPPQDMAHVRGLAHESGGSLVPSQALLQRKAKGHSVGIADEESILTFLTRSTDVATVQASIQSDIDNADHILPPPQGLRLPLKHFESGPKVQRRMRPRLKTYQRPLRVVESSDDELGPRVHPIIRRLFNSLRTSLSAYDRSDCENSSWAQKYAPQTTAEILQPGKEGSLLREWLLSLTVDSVDTGADPAAREKPLVDAKARGKKKRKRALEGFIVDSDDEADELDEVSDGEDSWASPVDRGLRSVIRHGDIKAKARDARLTNAVVISGPHGCGKTAAVYAIAKELDFEVFEINASSRRSGKDVLERVGDMTRNHLVRHHADEAQAEEDQTAEDVKSGKQGTMTSFFKPKGAAKTPNVKSASPKTSPKPQGPKSQKQSLILLEEVDILYEEDKQFWVTISSLIAQSKRPFIMTCNDETLLPFALLNLHGIFRFNPPPADLAVDAMLLVAANEGHVLERRPVEELYETRGRDLRASLTELNYWCQIGVGDRRGGMDWFYLRWPKGSDVDENGDVVRVISESTYQSGMGWFGDSARGDKQDEEEMVRESWEAWGVGCDKLLMPDGSMGAPCSVSEYADFMDSMSSADVLSSGAFGKAYEVCLHSYVFRKYLLTKTGTPRRDAPRYHRPSKGRLHYRPHAPRCATAHHLLPPHPHHLHGRQDPSTQLPLAASPAHNGETGD